ncbi:MAG: hypothetical protein EAZ39_02040 [Oscillatoriales cyanobacterium]|nr:MAG: hypothetical protein EAZ39_02040 [Oscillatoriales cyanobacterium]
MLISQGCENSGIEEISRFERRRGREGERERGTGRGFDEFWSRSEIYNLNAVELKKSGILTKAFCLC